MGQRLIGTSAKVAAAALALFLEQCVGCTPAAVREPAPAPGAQAPPIQSVAKRAAAPHPADRGWIAGTWRSYELDYGNFREWTGTRQLELVAASPDDVALWLISEDGGRRKAPESEPSRMDDSTLFFGPIGSGLLFRFQHADDVLTLDLDTTGTRIRVKLRRVPNAP
jgi:hypothetical protein